MIKRSSIIKFGEILFLMGMFTKQFYILPSGYIQIGDIFMVLGTIIIFLIFRLALFKKDLLLILFLLFVLGINTIYALLETSISFYLYSIYYVFNIFIVISLRHVIKDNQFLVKILNTVKYMLFCQLIIYITGIGTQYSIDRYMGTFNDPNQFAFFIFSSYLILIVISESVFHIKHLWFWSSISIFLILQSSSTGILIGLLSCICMRTITKIFNKNYSWKYLHMIVILGSFIILCYSLIFGITFPNKLNNINILNRIEEKINKFSGNGSDISGLNSFLTDRQLHKIRVFPHYLLFGSGEGEFSRFVKSSDFGEIHSTLPSILFYYGLIPFLILIFWIFLQLKNCRVDILAIYISLFLESFSLLNQRQPFFWVLLLLASNQNLKIINKKGKK